MVTDFLLCVRKPSKRPPGVRLFVLDKINEQKKSFTLVEVLMTLFLVSSAMVGTLSVFVFGSTFMTELRQHTVALQAAKEQVEVIRGLTFDEILALPSNFIANGFNELSDATGTRAVDDVNGSNDIRRVTVNVRWVTPRGRVLNQTLVTLMTREGINRR